jgi:orotate phosphoribosyltransferase
MQSIIGILEENDRHALLQRLKTYSVKISKPGEPEFNLAAGGTSRFYIDVKQTALHRDVHRLLAHALYTVLAHGYFGGIEAVAGVALGGCHLASIAALYAVSNNVQPIGLHVVYVRKEAKDHGMKKLVESTTLPQGTSVVLLEDVITTGGSSIKAIGELVKAGFDVRGVLAVIDRRTTENRTTTLPYEGKDYPLCSLYNLDDFQDML